MKRIIFSFVLITLFLTSCNVTREVNEISLINSVGVDYTKDQDYNLTIQYLKPVKNMEPKLITKTVSGISLYDANKRFNEFLPKRTYWSHNFVIILSEDIAKNGIRGTLDFFRRNLEMRQDVLILIAKKPSEILSKMQSENITGLNLKNTANDASKLTSTGELSTIHKIYQNLYFEDPNLRVTHISISGDDPRIDGLSVFKKDKYVTTIDGEVAKGWGLYDLGNDWSRMILNCNQSPSKKSKISYSIKNKDKKTSVTLAKDNKLHIKISGYYEAMITENQCMLDLKDPKNITKLENKLNQEITKTVLNTIKYAQNINVDYFGFGNLLYRSNPKQWKRIKADYPNRFNDANVNLDFVTKITQTGAVYD